MKYLVAALLFALVAIALARPSDYSGASGGRSEHTGHLGESKGVFMGNQGHSQQGGEVHGTLSNVGNKEQKKEEAAEEPASDDAKAAEDAEAPEEPEAQEESEAAEEPQAEEEPEAAEDSEAPEEPKEEELAEPEAEA
ncbi:cytochrome c1 isoform X2 [Aethina tumida]|uniref:cytochrome c1 isoform X1 n=1 Tax=Aethina tumida TaxID=116153 RepID=UPI00096B2F80|nr:cytochrome c1 isoform X1 [Aethina tumida]XP_049821868.1 cytochrome c1 isoform X2 [Aethina tumida]